MTVGKSSIIQKFTKGAIDDKYQVKMLIYLASGWEYIVSNQIESHLERTKRNLGSYTKRRDVKASIEFDKNLIL